MAKMTRYQLRALIRESINDSKNERLKRNLKKRLNLKIAERKLSSYKARLDEISLDLEDTLISEGVFDRIKTGLKSGIKNLKGGVDAAVSSLGREFLGGGAMPKGGYQKSGGLKSYELEQLASADPLRQTRDAAKKVAPALNRLKSTKISDLVDGHGLIALDSYVSTVVESLQSLAEFMKDLNAQKETSESSPADSDEYLDLATKVQEFFEQAKEIIKSLQRDVQQAAIDLQKGSEPALRSLNIDS